jgi:anti-anti-sigma factor
MTLQLEQIDSITVLSLHGKLNIDGCPEFEKAITALPAGGRILFDLSKLDYVASAGLRLFLVAAKASAQKKGQLVVCGLTTHVAEVFKLTGFNTFLTIESDRSAGMKKLRP